MEVHHHSHTSRKKWTHYFWEFLMLFLAVTLGFLVENFREHYVERLRVKQYARALIGDLEADTAMMQKRIFRINRNLKWLDSFSIYVNRHRLNEMRNLELFVLSTYDRYAPYTWSRATIEQIKNSGSLRYFTNDSIIRRITNYDAFTRHMDEDFSNDDERANRVSELRSEIMSMDYPPDFAFGLRNNLDSVLNTSFYKELSLSDEKPILATDIKMIRIFLNEKMNLAKHYLIRTQEELPQLIKDGEELIKLLKDEYY